MTEQSELVAVGAGDLGSVLLESGIQWVHLPVKDFGGLKQRQAADWPELSARLRDTVQGGGRVLVHCRGGLGRSGMILLRLMCELGENPERALERLRTVRPGAVETAEQMAWAKAGSGLR